jgi:hypothetical protein
VAGLGTSGLGGLNGGGQGKGGYEMNTPAWLRREGEIKDTSFGVNHIPYGYCQCGCGQKTNIALVTCKSKNWKKGEPLRYVRYHNLNRNNLLKNKKPKSYLQKVYNGKLTRDHVYIIENIMGKPLPSRAVIHHVDGNKHNNNPKNLVVCQDRRYHGLLHRRINALTACGNPNYRKCTYCKKWDAPENLIITKRRSGNINYDGPIYHRECKQKYHRR